MLSTIEDIRKLLNTVEKETTVLELKSFDKILQLNDKNKKDIACEIIAFANRAGGKIIFGVKDDGIFEQAKEVELDEIKAKIHNICFDSVSPVIETNTQYIADSQNHVLIVHVPKRKGIPHAFIDKRSGPEISSRVYYIRTSHGKKLVSDGQLQWLFQHTDEPKYNSEFRIGFELDRGMNLISEVVPLGNYEFSYFRELLSGEDREYILKNSKFPEFIKGLLPFLVLKSLSSYFKDSWHIEIRRGFNRMSSGPILTDANILSSSYYIHEIPVKGDSIVQQLAWDFKRILKEIVPFKFHLPSDTSIEVRYDKHPASSVINFENPAFKIKLYIGMLSGGAGLHQRGILNDLLFKRYSLEVQQNSLGDFLHYDAACYLSGTFNYPEYDMSEFEKYLGFYNSIKSILEYEWDFEMKRGEFPPKEIIVLDDKLNEILEILKVHIDK
ncbi:MAG TPA: ATP-binding protein [Chitinophagaceae bacterium]|jgi:hypothetical protein|nr:ATP-binding protein [Chitinophagaceae bacterium]